MEPEDEAAVLLGHRVDSEMSPQRKAHFKVEEDARGAS
jgi:hypothetical protein